jgi:aldose 1-epimerase
MVKSELFGKTTDGRDITAYTIDNGHISCRVLDFGAVLMNLYTPDQHGTMSDLVLGFDNAEQYETNKDFFGALIGPVANRTANGRFVLNGHEYQLPVNDGPNNLHTDADLGLHKKLWKAMPGGDFVTFTVEVPDGECGLPGTRNFTVTYTITEDNALRIHYHVTSDVPTYINPTNHAYFNLDGHAAGAESVLNTEMQLFCSHYTPVDKESIPTGETAPVSGTPFDFRDAKKIGQDIEADNEQLHFVGGYDHNFVVDEYTGDGEYAPVAVAYSAKSGRVMEVFSTLPGVQFYTGNYVDDKGGKQGTDYDKRAAFCLETQYFPDAINHDNFEKPIYGGNKIYDSLTKYRFSVR